jgi:hypothetical protein
MKFNLDVKIELRDKNGKVTKVIKRRCHSYTRQMIDLLLGSMLGSGATSCKDTAGASHTDWSGYDTFSSGAAAADNTIGIQVGTGTNAVTISDFVLQTLIANGNAATQLSYGSVSIGAVAIVGSTAKFTIARTLTNNSGADITVNEVGLVSQVISRNYKNLIERTLLTFTVANTTSGTVTYSISVTV